MMEKEFNLSKKIFLANKMAETRIGRIFGCENCGYEFFTFNNQPISCSKCGSKLELLASTNKSDIDVQEKN